MRILEQPRSRYRAASGERRSVIGPAAGGRGKRRTVRIRGRPLVLMVITALSVVGCAEVPPQPRYHAMAEPPSTCGTAPAYRAVGTASWYGRPYHGRRTASGEIYNMHRFTAAHRSLPFGTRIKVTNIRNGRSVLLTVNDRGPFVRGRIVDVSYRAASELNFARAGLAPVRVQSVAGC